MSQQRRGGARQKLAVTRLSHIFIFIRVVNSLLKVSICLEAYVTLKARSAGVVAKISFGYLYYD